jgi:hypothetical protein
MKRLAAFILLGSLLALTSGVERAAPTSATLPGDTDVAFVPVHVFIDPHGKPLACYQVRITATAGDATLVGIEGGDSSAFNNAPYYDPRALQGNRIILGAYSLDPNPPAGNTRVATLMFRVAGSTAPSYDAMLEVAGTTDAKPIAATVSLAIAAGLPRGAAKSSLSNGDAR